MPYNRFVPVRFPQHAEGGASTAGNSSSVHGPHGGMGAAPTREGRGEGGATAPPPPRAEHHYREARALARERERAPGHVVDQDDEDEDEEDAAVSGVGGEGRGHEAHRDGGPDQEQEGEGDVGDPEGAVVLPLKRHSNRSCSSCWQTAQKHPRGGEPAAARGGTGSMPAAARGGSVAVLPAPPKWAKKTPTIIGEVERQLLGYAEGKGMGVGEGACSNSIMSLCRAELHNLNQIGETDNAELVRSRLIDEVWKKYCVSRKSNIGDDLSSGNTPTLRRAALSLVGLLCGDRPTSLWKVIDLVIEQNSPVHRPIWENSPLKLKSSSNTYVGLCNLGATCYINALVQQLYMNVPFRRSILESKLPPSSKEALDDSILYQVQLLFGGLMKSGRECIDPRGLCNALRKSGIPIDLSRQMDVDEFFTQLRDGLTAEIKAANNSDILHECFGGKQCQRIKCKVCEKTSDQHWPFYALQLEVRDMATTAVSLSKYFSLANISVNENEVEGGTGYQCNTCNKLVDALKGYSLEEFPATLILH